MEEEEDNERMLQSWHELLSLKIKRVSASANSTLYGSDLGVPTPMVSPSFRDHSLAATANQN